VLGTDVEVKSQRGCILLLTEGVRTRVILRKLALSSASSFSPFCIRLKNLTLGLKYVFEFANIFLQLDI
jgi:hypothetical protein